MVAARGVQVRDQLAQQLMQVLGDQRADDDAVKKLDAPLGARTIAALVQPEIESHRFARGDRVRDSAVGNLQPGGVPSQRALLSRDRRISLAFHCGFSLRKPLCRDLVLRVAVPAASMSFSSCRTPPLERIAHAAQVRIVQPVLEPFLDRPG